MPVSDYQATSSPFSSFGRSLLSLRRDTAAMPSGEEADLEAFQRHVAAALSELLPPEAGDEVLSAAWIRRLLEAFVLCQEEFRVVVAQARRRGGALPPPAERLVAEFHERAIKALDVCNAARDGVDQVRRWERLAAVAASAPGEEVHEGQLRRARKALSDLAGHRNRSFGRATPSRSAVAGSGSSHFRSLFWSVSRTWSAARQLQASGAGLARTTRALPRPSTPWAASSTSPLVAAVPCPDRAAAGCLPLGAASPRPARTPRRGGEA
jgi:hypothetical protein